MHRGQTPCGKLAFLRGLTPCLAGLLAATFSAQVYAEELRDPFTFGSRVTSTQTSPTLVGILWMADQPVAIIGEETLGIGDTVGDWQILDIQQDSLILQRGDRQETITPGESLPSG